jgi:hypothetical protein
LHRRPPVRIQLFESINFSEGVNGTLANSAMEIACWNCRRGAMADEKKQETQSSPQNEREQASFELDLEARQRREAVAQQIAKNNRHRLNMERALDQTLADSFPASDPPSSIPDPGEEEPYAA